MKQITFLGAAGTVTGSSYFLTDHAGQGIMVDCGMFQGADEIEGLNYESIPLHPSDVQAVCLTHAHLDHSGRLPLLRKFGFKGPIYMTEATKALVELTLMDSAHVLREHATHIVLYVEEDVEWVLRQAVIVEYEKPIHIGNFSVTYRDAGHILGSSFLEVVCQDQKDGIKKIIFSGDIGNYPEELVKPTEFARDADVVLIESTYGDREHAKEDPKEVLAEEINDIEKNGATLLIPAFSVERTQEILHLIDHLKKNKRVMDQTPVFLDSTLGTRVTHVYQRYRALYNQEIHDHNADDPFTFPGLTMIENARQSRDIREITGAKVIIAGSGMMNGGRILGHAKHYLPVDTTRLLVVGFQAIGTLGRALLDGATHVVIDGVEVPVRAHIRKSSGMSSHADQPKLLQWLETIEGVTSICLVHGENMQRKIFAEKIKERTPDIAVYLPMRGDTRSFGLEKTKTVLVGSSGGKKPKLSF